MIVDAFDGKHGKRQLLREKNSSAAFIKPFPSISLLGVIQRGFAGLCSPGFQQTLVSSLDMATGSLCVGVHDGKLLVL